MNIIKNWAERTQRRMTMMQRMIQRLDVDSSKIICDDNGVTFRAMIGRCRGCEQPEVCSAWLDGKRPESSPQAFCPNAAAFEPYRSH
ncbi:DUF6455 family protein [Thauera humireducens]|jgi:hypothetical protein|uniref:DUF6455 family protein n=1 Tax=Thauera humireducens TaxID=1134435 RepID=UPI00311DD41D